MFTIDVEHLSSMAVIGNTYDLTSVLHAVLSSAKTILMSNK